MAIKILELHHHAVRAAPGRPGAAASRRFYSEILGLDPDEAPWDAGEGGQRINTGRASQIHLIPAPEEPGALRTPIDPTAPHVALAVLSIDEAQSELDRLSVPYRVVHGRLGPDSRQVFITDPAGNVIELHQLGTCRCTARSREGPGYARVRGTVLFADMRGFTSIAERLSPDDVVPLLNAYFSMLTDVTAEHGGTVFHMAGDGLMAGFGLPKPLPDASGRAVAAARGMIAGFARLAGDWKSRLGLDTGIGIGINEGDVIVGDVGAPARASYTLIGDTVNVAARLVQRARAGEALLSHSVRQAIGTGLDAVVQLPPLVLRGRSRPVEIWCLPSGMRLDLRPATA